MKSAFITGGTSGIGEEVVSRLLGLNYQVSYTSRRKNVEESRTNSNVYELDMCDTVTIDSLIETLASCKSRFDLILLNAGYTEFVPLKDTLEALTPELFEKVLNANLSSNYRLIHGLSPMVKPGGHVIMISSVAAYTGIGSNLAYTLSKQSLKTMTAILAKNNKYMIRFNAVAPGLTRTNFTDKFPDDYFENYRKDTPLARLSSVQDIADAILSLETDLKFVNGQTILVDGGYY